MPSGFDVCAALKQAQEWGSDQNRWILNFWVQHVKPGGNWDFKQVYNNPAYQDAGNYIYGLTGRAYGLNSDDLQAAAGVANILENGWRGADPGSWFDSKAGHPWVIQGIADFDNGYWKSHCACKP
jgi:hypothetical protein